MPRAVACACGWYHRRPEEAGRACTGAIASGGLPRARSCDRTRTPHTSTSVRCTPRRAGPPTAPRPDHRQPPLPARGAPASSASPETQSSAVALRRQTVHSGTSSHPRPPVPGWRRRGGGRRAARLGPSRYAQACHPARRTARTLPSVSADARHQDGSTRLPLVAVQEASTSKGCGGAHRTTVIAQPRTLQDRAEVDRAPAGGRLRLSSERGRSGRLFRGS